MPKGDRTGPMGAGSMSGRGAGLCSELNTTGYANEKMAGRSRMNRGCRRGRGMRGPTAGNGGWQNRGFAPDQPSPMYTGSYPAPSRFSKPVSEEASLRDQSRALQSELNAIEKRIEKIEGQKT